MSKQELLEKISRSGKLPILPDIAVRVLVLRDDPELYPAKVQGVIASDPVLAGKILQVSNSAMFRGNREIKDLAEAVTVLGVELTMDIATGLAVVNALRSDEIASSAFPYELFWRKSILSAIAANEMISELGSASRGELFVAALLQDIGMLALNNMAGERYGQLVQTARSHFDLVELEERALGVNHAEVTAAILRQWTMPDSIVAAVESSHALFDASAITNLSDLQYGVAVAGVLAELWIADSLPQESLNRMIHAYLDKVGEEAYRDTVASILDAIPGANQMFNIKLLSDEQMANVA